MFDFCCITIIIIIVIIALADLLGKEKVRIIHEPRETVKYVQRCKNCGMLNSEHDRYCSHCGKRL